MIDPLDIVNEFVSIPYDMEGVELPFCPKHPHAYHSEHHNYWEKRLCALAERTANAENEVDRLKKRLRELRRNQESLDNAISRNYQNNYDHVPYPDEEYDR